MKVFTDYLWFNTKKRQEFVRITDEVSAIVKKSGTSRARESSGSTCPSSSGWSAFAAGVESETQVVRYRAAAARVGENQ